jgi:hypothetical protein
MFDPFYLKIAFIATGQMEISAKPISVWISEKMH